MPCNSKANKRVVYNWVTEIMIYDWVHKGYTKLGMVSVFGKWIKSLNNKQTKLNFLNWLHQQQKCRLLAQTATWRPKRTVLTPNVYAILKASTDINFLGPSLGGCSECLIYVWRFLNKRDNSAGDWLDPVIQYLLGLYTMFSKPGRFVQQYMVRNHQDGYPYLNLS